MFVVTVNAPDGTTRRVIFVAGQVTIGAREDSDLCIPGADPRHARFVIRDECHVFVDLKSDRGSTCNGKPITQAFIVRARDRIEIAGHALQIVDVAPGPLAGNHVAADATEHALLDAIADGDDDSVSIYCDWLESRGDLVRAEIVRRRGNGRHVSVPFLALLLGSETAWRVRVLRPPIEGCARGDCPGEWGVLAQGPRDAVRRCGTCATDVRYCTSVTEASADLARGVRVVIDPLALRWSGDLHPVRPGD